MASGVDLSGRRAIVTGGATGTGRAVAQRLIDDGAMVMIWDADRGRAEMTAEDLGASFIDADVTDWARVQSATARAMAEMGGVDILVNAAALYGPRAPVTDYPVEDWRRVMAANLDGVFHCCKALAPHMAAAGFGRIVTVAATAGLTGDPNAAAFAASKAGVIALTRSLGAQLAKHDIAVNCVAPALTPGAAEAWADDAQIAESLARSPRGRAASAAEVAATIAWLCSADCAFATGAVFDMSGGAAGG